MGKAVIGIVESTQQAEEILAQLQAAGVPTSDMSILFPDKTGTKDFAHEHNTKAPEGAIAGVGTGGVLGGVVGLLAGIGALAIPGFGPLIAAGPLMAALSGAAAGAAVGGIGGALIGMGIPEYEAKQYEGKVKGGNILIAVSAGTADARKAIEAVLERAGAHDIKTTTEASVPKRERSAREPEANGEAAERELAAGDLAGREDLAERDERAARDREWNERDLDLVDRERIESRDTDPTLRR